MSTPEDNDGLEPLRLVQETSVGTFVVPLALNERVVTVLASSDEGVLPSDLVDEVIAASPELDEYPEVTLTAERVRAAVEDVRNLGISIYIDSETGALQIPTEEE